jgi:predicted peptidase
MLMARPFILWRQSKSFDPFASPKSTQEHRLRMEHSGSYFDKIRKVEQRMIKHFAPSLLVAVMLAMPVQVLQAVFARSRDTGFLNRTILLNGTTYRYQVYVPADWSKRKRWPVILFLHGAGERGDDGLIQTEVGIGTAIRRHSERFPCIVVFPQCRKGLWWTDAQMEAQALKALDQAMKEFNADPQMVYLTGISMGGYGTWHMASRNPGRFAALAPVCGGIRPPAGLETGHTQTPPSDPYAATAEKIGSTPVWVFHGEADPVVPVAESRKMVEALKAIGGNVRYSEYPGVGHNSWDKAYAEPDFVPWLLSYKLKSRNPL